MYLLKLALRPWRLAPLSQIFSGIAVGFLLLLVGFLFWMQNGLKGVLVRLQGEQVITAYLDNSVENKNEEKIVDAAREALGPTPEIKLVNTSLFIKHLRAQYPDLSRELEDLGQETNQIVPRYVSISGILPDSAIEKIKVIPGIEHAESSKDRYHHIVGAFSALRWVARILMAGICLALLTGLIHLSRMNAYLHKDALSLLHFWGAGSATLASPSILSGISVGLLGGVIAWSGWITIGVWLARHVRSISTILKGMPPVHPHLAFALLVLGAIIGLFAGALGSFSYSQLKTKEG